MTTPFTPGPWFVTRSGLSCYVEAKINGALIQEVAWCGATLKDEQEDNARLIAAAPDLLEALKKLLQNQTNVEVLGEWEALDTNFNSRKKMRAQVDEVIAQGLAALAKATGA